MEEQLNQLLHYFFDERRNHAYEKFKDRFNIDRLLAQLERDGLIERIGEVGRDDTKYILSFKGELLRNTIREQHAGEGYGYTIYLAQEKKRKWAEEHPILEKWRTSLITGLIALIVSIGGSLIVWSVQGNRATKIDIIQNHRIDSLFQSIKHER